MCNRYRMTASRADLLARFGVVVDIDEPNLPAPELFPKREAWVVRNGPKGRELTSMAWGVPPPKAGTAPVTNVRNLESRFWRPTLARPDRRCLVPVTSFCEWEGEKGEKVARWFSVPSQPIFAFAGIWQATAGGNVFAFLTCDPNPLVASVHPKAMPVILPIDEEEYWLTDGLGDAMQAATPFPSQLMAMT